MRYSTHFWTCQPQEITEWAEADHHSTSNGSNSRRGNSRELMQRQSTVRGRTQPLFRSLPDKSLMLRTSERPPMYYMALGKVRITVYICATFCNSSSLKPAPVYCCTVVRIGYSLRTSLQCYWYMFPTVFISSTITCNRCRSLPWPYSTAYPKMETISRMKTVPLL